MVKGAVPSDLSTLWSSHSRWPGAPSWASSRSSDTAEPWCAISLTLHRWLSQCLSPAAAANGTTRTTWPRDSNFKMLGEGSAVLRPNGAEMMPDSSAPSPVARKCLTMSLPKTVLEMKLWSPSIHTLSLKKKSPFKNKSQISKKKKKKKSTPKSQMHLSELP